MYLEFNAIGLKFCAEVKATRFVPASVCGLPENCFESEGGEVLFETLTYNDKDVLFLVQDADDKLREVIEIAAYEEFIKEYDND